MADGAIATGLRDAVVCLLTTRAPPAGRALALKVVHVALQHTAAAIFAGSRLQADIRFLHLAETGGEAQRTEALEGGRRVGRGDGLTGAAVHAAISRKAGVGVLAQVAGVARWAAKENKDSKEVSSGRR